MRLREMFRHLGDLQFVILDGQSLLTVIIESSALFFSIVFGQNAESFFSTMLCSTDAASVSPGNVSASFSYIILVALDGQSFFAVIIGSKASQFASVSIMLKLL